MKSTQQQLKNRGFASEKFEKEFEKKSVDELHILLKSNLAFERTLSARTIAKTNNSESLKYLCIALESEKALYTKIEICNAIISFGKLALPYLIEMMGKIGNNQHKTIDTKKFKKKSYPLPRDIAARTIIRLEIDALPHLINVLQSDNILKLSEAIDAIGYICFYNKKEKYYPELVDCFSKNSDYELIRWKIVRAMSAFPESLEFLNLLSKQEKNGGIKQEIERSLSLIKRRDELDS